MIGKVRQKNNVEKNDNMANGSVTLDCESLDTNVMIMLCKV